MPPPASILIPTYRRRDYLAVALGSVAAQAAEHGAELIVVEDDPADPETQALAERHGARYLAHGESRGPNAARNTAIEASSAELLCFLDDDVEVWPGWLGALLAAAEAHPDHDAFGGPIRARLEGTNLHACGREPPPVTTLDLGARRPRRRVRVGREHGAAAARRWSASAPSTPASTSTARRRTGSGG